MRNETIDILIDEEGNITYEGQGFKGNGCVTGMKWLEGLVEVVKRKFTGGRKEKKVRVSH